MRGVARTAVRHQRRSLRWNEARTAVRASIRRLRPGEGAVEVRNQTAARTRVPHARRRTGTGTCRLRSRASANRGPNDASRSLAPQSSPTLRRPSPLGGVGGWGRGSACVTQARPRDRQDASAPRVAPQCSYAGAARSPHLMPTLRLPSPPGGEGAEMSRLHLVGDFAVLADVQAQGFFLFFDTQADKEVDRLEDDEGHRRGVGPRRDHGDELLE